MTVLDYALPDGRIALRPLLDRSSSKLLVADATHLEDRRFAEIVELLPAGTLLVVNDTRVIRARIMLHKSTGGVVEMLLLEPVSPSTDPAVALASRESSTWACLLAGKRLRPGDTFSKDGLDVTVRERDATEAVVDLRWPTEWGTLGDVIDRFGRTPLPPYIRRPDDDADVPAYQTVYAREPGSVAAPTAGLHFTPALLEALRTRGVRIESVTLHVGAGTFRPIQVDNVREHVMHAERVSASKTLLCAVADQLSAGGPIVAVGTTSARSLESLGWLGAQLVDGQPPLSRLAQWCWRDGVVTSPVTAFRRLAQCAPVVFDTQLMITPGYPWGVVDGLATNFHQPRSTLLMLVASLLGGARWRAVYDHALAGDYRFLSYGDASLLWRRHPGAP